MRKGKVLVEQVMWDGSIVDDYDYSLSVMEIKRCLEKYFPEISTYKTGGLNFFVGTYKNSKYAIRCKNITYLGNPHPKYKKRIQIPDDLQLYYKTAKEIGAKPILLGVYERDNCTVFVDFRIDTYIEKKAHNSSAHIYTQDISTAITEGYFQKTDYFGNTITVFPAKNVAVFLNEYLEENHDSLYQQDTKLLYKKSEAYKFNDSNGLIESSIEVVKEEDYHKKLFEFQQVNSSDTLLRRQVYEENLYNVVVPKIEEFFLSIKKEWFGIECYREMINACYKNKFQSEWPGFYLEYQFEKYIHEKKISDVVKYCQDKKKGGIDLDLYFPVLKTYGDLKSHSSNSSGIPDNDWDTVMSILDKNNHIYYIICENVAKKDSDYQYEVTNYWNKVQKKKDLMSYHKKMKHSVTLTKMYILDINCDNRKYLTIFKQGINSNGKPRKPKIMIEDKNLEHFVIAESNL